MRWRVGACALAVALACSLWCAPAYAAASRGPVTDLEMTVSVEGELNLSRVDMLALPATCDPQSIQVGIPCGMTEMCGQDPCLCGRVDEYGACACNGTQEAKPTYTVEFDDSNVARAVELFGTVYLIPLGSGETRATVVAHLPHHADAVAETTVHVAGFGVLDAVKIAALLAAAAAVVAAVVFVLRAMVLAVRGLVGRLSERRRAAKGE